MISVILGLEHTKPFKHFSSNYLSCFSKAINTHAFVQGPDPRARSKPAVKIAAVFAFLIRQRAKQFSFKCIHFDGIYDSPPKPPSVHKTAVLQCSPVDQDL